MLIVEVVIVCGLINPLRMRRRVAVVVLCVCLSVTNLVARQLISAVQAWYQQNQHETSKVFNSWISLKTLCSKVMAFGAAIYEVLFVFYSYTNDDTELER